MDHTATPDSAALIALVRGVRQVRQFRPDPVPEPAIDDILEVARWTGSGSNTQPWDLVLVRNRATLQEIAAAEGKNAHLAGATFAIVIAMAGQAAGIQDFDEGRLTERMMIAAAAHGLGAGIWWFKDGGEAARRILGIPAERRVGTAISFGYPAAMPAGRPVRPGAGRRPRGELVHEERY